MDLAGNAYLEQPPILVDIQGGPAKPVQRSQRRLKSPFQGKSERIVRCLVLEPQRPWTMRKLASAADASLGLASMVTTTLADMGLVAKDRSGMQILNPAGILDAWASHYDLRRSPFQVFRSSLDMEGLYERLRASQNGVEERYALTLWSGAEALLDQTAGAPHLALYWQDQPDLLDAALDLSRGDEGTLVFVFRPYDESLLWRKKRTDDGLTVVGPLQLYLDLSSGDEKELELAQRVRERLLDL
jgi:hypothetical protein